MSNDTLGAWRSYARWFKASLVASSWPKQALLDRLEALCFSMKSGGRSLPGSTRTVWYANNLHGFSEQGKPRCSKQSIPSKETE